MTTDRAEDLVMVVYMSMIASNSGSEYAELMTQVSDVVEYRSYLALISAMKGYSRVEDAQKQQRPAWIQL